MQAKEGKASMVNCTSGLGRYCVNVSLVLLLLAAGQPSVISKLIGVSLATQTQHQYWYNHYTKVI